MAPSNRKKNASRTQKQSSQSFPARNGDVAGGEREMHGGAAEISIVPTRAQTHAHSFPSSSSPCSPVSPVSKRQKRERSVATVPREGEMAKTSSTRRVKPPEAEEAVSPHLLDLSSVLPAASLSSRAERHLYTAIQATPCLPSPLSPLLSPLLPLASDAADNTASPPENDAPKKRSVDRSSPSAGRGVETKRDEEAEQGGPTDTASLHTEGEHRRLPLDGEGSGVVPMHAGPPPLLLPEQHEKLVWRLSSALHAVYLITMTDKAQRGGYSSASTSLPEGGSRRHGGPFASPPLASVWVNGRWLAAVALLQHSVPLTMDDLARLSQLFPQWLRIQWRLASSLPKDTRPLSSSLSFGDALPVSGSSSSPLPLQARLYLTANHVVSIEEAATALRERLSHAAAEEEEAVRLVEVRTPFATQKKNTNEKGPSEREDIHTPEGIPKRRANTATDGGGGPLRGLRTAYQAFLAQQQEQQPQQRSSSSLVSHRNTPTSGHRESPCVPSAADAVESREEEPRHHHRTASSSSLLSTKKADGHAVPLPNAPSHSPLPSSSASSAIEEEEEEEGELSTVLSPALRQSLSKEKLSQVLAQWRMEHSGEARRQYEAICGRRVREDLLRIYTKIRSAMGKRRSFLFLEPNGGGSSVRPPPPPAATSLLSRRSAPSAFGVKKVHMSIAQLLTHLQAEREQERRRGAGASFGVEDALRRPNEKDASNGGVEMKGEVRHLLQAIDALVRFPSSGLRLQHISTAPMGSEDPTNKEEEGQKEEEEKKNVSHTDGHAPHHLSAISPSVATGSNGNAPSLGDSFSLAGVPAEEWHHVLLFLDQSLANVKELAVAVETVSQGAQ